MIVNDFIRTLSLENLILLHMNNKSAPSLFDQDQCLGYSISVKSIMATKPAKFQYSS